MTEFGVRPWERGRPARWRLVADLSPLRPSRPRSQRCCGVATAIALLALSACGGGGGEADSSGSPLATVRTLAYVVSACREDATRRSIHQELRIRQGDHDPVTMAVTDVVQESPVLRGTCRLYGRARLGITSIFAFPVQRFGVSPDGSSIVFEKTTRFSIWQLPPLAPDDEGFFFVRADGNGLRRLGPPSRESLSRFSSIRFRGNYDDTPLSFSADGRTVVFSDRGPGPDGDAAQVVTLDLATGSRVQLTHLPGATPVDPSALDVHTVRFLPDGRIIFGTRGNLGYTVRPDGTDLKAEPLPVILPGGIDPTFKITGDLVTAINLGLPNGTFEVFLLDHANLLQLTHFHRQDTSRATVDVDGERVFFIASANPPESGGGNPSENCQIFSIDRLGTNLRQLTDFNPEGHSALGCTFGGGPPPGCNIEPGRQDPVTRALVFPSSCDPFGMNPNGEQVFAMHPDGSGLQQLTDTRGITTEADGTVDVELPGPFASTAVRR
jgi:hypothetical protein